MKEGKLDMYGEHTRQYPLRVRTVVDGTYMTQTRSWQHEGARGKLTDKQRARCSRDFSSQWVLAHAKARQMQSSLTAAWAGSDWGPR